MPRAAISDTIWPISAGWSARRDWLAGDNLTYADLAAAAHLSAVDYLGDVPWNEDETAKNWYARIKSRPVVPRAARRDAGRAAAVAELRQSRLLTPGRAQDGAVRSRAPRRASMRSASRGRTRSRMAAERAARIPRRRRAWRHGLDGGNADRRADPRALWPEVRSIIMLGVNYGPDDDPLAILRAAHARRHLGLCPRRRLSRRHQAAAQGPRALADRAMPAATIKVFVDTAPVMEKPLAAAAGLGWQGKHTNLVSRQLRLVAVPRRDFHDARSAGRRGRSRPLRHLPRLSRHLPDRGVSRRPTGSMRGAAFPISPSSIKGRSRARCGR